VIVINSTPNGAGMTDQSNTRRADVEAVSFDTTWQHVHHGDDDQGTHQGHGGHERHAADFQRLFWISFVLSVPVV
jgi:hypothetical protein